MYLSQSSLQFIYYLDGNDHQTNVSLSVNVLHVYNIVLQQTRTTYMATITKHRITKYRSYEAIQNKTTFNLCYLESVLTSQFSSVNVSEKHLTNVNDVAKQRLFHGMIDKVNKCYKKIQLRL